MKESRRHRWVPLGIIKVDQKPGESSHALCRDCGLEVKREKVKTGGQGECPGKMAEQQRGLSLISGDPQSLDNEWTAASVIACAGCGKAPALMLAHRNERGEVTGWLYACGQCIVGLRHSEVIIRPMEKGEVDGEEG